MFRKLAALAMDRLADSLAWRIAQRMDSGGGGDFADIVANRVAARFAETERRIFWMDAFDHRNIPKIAHHQGSLTSVQYWREHMSRAAGFAHRDEVLYFAVDRAVEPGLWLEFGVYTGGSISGIARRWPDIVIHGFDSFEGLPDVWAFNPKGAFDVGGKLPDVPDNVRLYKGWYEDTVPRFFAVNPGKIAYIHIDCDMYSSTKTVFDHCWDRLQPGTIIAFDEYWNYSGWEDHEFRAFQEMVAERGIGYEYLTFCTVGEQVAVKITRTP